MSTLIQPEMTVGAFTSQESAAAAVKALQAAGIANDHIGLVAAGPADPPRHRGDKPADGMEAGAATGVLVGSSLGGLAVATAGVVTAGGLLIGLLAGAAAGSLLGGFIGLGVHEEKARKYETGIQSGRVLVFVRAGDRVREVVDILTAQGADEIELPTVKPND